ncbi:hypothetical protein B0A52_05454 [Exophiala mesophila]|uniref:Uncharacterized protein n=1 Tax=Exophiala mesophila TaxID=212818 RepID=A0A438N554_EXOME|nr:hypothetical protein B0A52_05454 [Exophiala mesophila]
MSEITPGDGADRQIRARLDSTTAYKTVAILVLTLVLYKAIARSRRSHELPPWTILETGLVVAVIIKSATARRIYTAISRYGGPLLGITSTHQVVVGLQGTDRFLSQPPITLSADTFQQTIMTRVGGLTNTPEMMNKWHKTWRKLLEPIERMFLNDTVAAAAIERAQVVQKASYLVSFADSTHRMKPWEASANVRLITPESAETVGVVEADFLKLIRDFGACIAIPLLYGQDFLNRYPNLLDDLWRVDVDLLLLLLIGVPPWAPFRTVRKGMESRSRLLRELGSLYKRIHQHLYGLPIDFDADMSDVSPAAMERSEIYHRTGWTFKEQGEGDFAILWGQNANLQPIIF